MTSEDKRPRFSDAAADVTAAVLERDQHRCVICHQAAETVEYLFAPLLFDNGGEFTGNAVSVCATHRTAMLETRLSVEEAMQHAGIAERPLPPQLHAVERYDRWGNLILENNKRARGELFFNPDVQHWLARGEALSTFTHYVKYPRTYCLPWSEEIGVGDRVMESTARLAAGQVIATEKLDGENVTLYRDFLHTRTVSRISHESRAWLDRFWENIRQQIPEGWRICGEYLFVTHTVSYDALPSYFMGFSVWDDRNTCLGWDKTGEFLEAIGIARVPELYSGTFDRSALESGWRTNRSPDSEGYIVRSAGSIAMREFRYLCGKFIRTGFHQSEPVRNNIRTGVSYSTNRLGSL